MKRLKGKHLRRVTSAILRRLNSVYGPGFERSVLLRDIDDCLSFMERQAREGSKATLENLADQISLSRLAVACIGLLALSLYGDDEEDQLFPIDWLNDSGRPNANHILQCMLTQLSNFALSATLLLERGLDNPARAMCRLVSELSQQILVVTYSRGDFQAYITGHDEKSSTEVWHALFAKGKLNRRLAEIEEKLGFDLELGSYMKSMRKSNYEFYSQAVHHSFIANTVGAYFQKFEGSEQTLGVFGGENRAIEPTLRYLNFSLWYFLLCFFSILDKHHKTQPKNPRGAFWLEAFMLYFCVKEGYLLLNAEANNSIKGANK